MLPPSENRLMTAPYRDSGSATELNFEILFLCIGRIFELFSVIPILGLSVSLYEDLLHQAHETERHGDATLCHRDTLQTIRKYLSQGSVSGNHGDGDDVTPLILHGAAGSGKTAVMATVARECCTQKDWTKAVCVTRFMHCSPQSETQQQLISSVAEQLCLLLEIPKTFALQVSLQFLCSCKK